LKMRFSDIFFVFIRKGISVKAPIKGRSEENKGISGSKSNTGWVARITTSPRYGFIKMASAISAAITRVNDEGTESVSILKIDHCCFEICSV
jgi:hypothetical protein